MQSVNTCLMKKDWRMIMDLEEIYRQLGGDYDSVSKRLLTDERIIKYLLKFLDKNMDVVIMDALEAKDWEIAFREAHNLKGVCANLNLDKLEASASELTEALRGGEPSEDITSLVQAMQTDYKTTVEALNNLR